MSALLIRGSEVAVLKKQEIKKKIAQHIAKGGRSPALAVILVGSDPASKIYVNNKRKACEEVGIISHFYDLAENTSQDELLNLILKLNNTSTIDGILIQLPLPSQIESYFIMEHLSPLKDVDGFHPYNLGRLAQKNPALRPCTPRGIISLFKHYKLEIEGKHAVIVGASNIVGRPMSLEFLLEGATVSICHSLTQNLEEFIRNADIIVSATGVRNAINPEWLQPHQVLIDVGIHRLDNVIQGDIDFEKAKDKVAWITPVPGGVGPMTVVSLLENTLIAAGID